MFSIELGFTYGVRRFSAALRVGKAEMVRYISNRNKDTLDRTSQLKNRSFCEA